MRLTVRTLLAWLDNVLPAGEQHELGDKVAASAAAQQLVERIRRVVERPTVPAPRVDGKGLARDANSVACFLDNTLEHDRLEEFERVLIESDMHLAEVAACHQLIATFAEDPLSTMPLDDERRARLLTAMQHRLAVRFAAVEREEQVANAQAVGAALRSTADVGGNDARGLGDQIDTVLIDRQVPAAASAGSQRRSSMAAWASALAALMLLLLLGGLLYRSLAGRRDATAAAKAAVANPAEVAAAAATVPPEVVSEPPTEQPTEQPAAAISPAPAPEPSPAPTPEPVKIAVDEGPVAESPPTAAPAPAPPPAADMPRVPQGDALAIAAPLLPGPPSPPAAGVPVGQTPQPTTPFDPPSSPEPTPAPAIGFVANGGMLLHRVVLPAVAGAAARAVWVPFASGAALEPREEVLVPAGAYPEVSLGGVTIRPLPATRATLTVDPDGTPRIEIAFGRVVARASRGDARLGVIAGGLSGTIMAGLLAPVAIGVELDRPPGSDPTLDPARVRAGITTAAGGIVWKQSAVDGEMLAGIGPEGMLDARQSILWDGAKPRVAAVVRLPAPPSWLESFPQSDRVERGAGEALAARIASGTPFDRALREMSSDRRAENRMLAASTLGMLGEYDELVELLGSEGAGRKLENRQWLSLEGATVPLALARGEMSAGRLHETFDRIGPPGRGELLFRMACGFSDEQLAAGADAELVAALEDSSLIVRRYAFKCLCEIVGPSAADKAKYRPDGLPELRQEGVSWWRSQQEKAAIRWLERR